MRWLVFSYSLTAARGSTKRVALWRRLQRLGAIPVRGGLYVLPEREDCLEAFQWLAQEVQEAGGEATLMRVERFEGLSDSQLIELFRQACARKYNRVQKSVDRIEENLRRQGKVKERSRLRQSLQKLQHAYEEISRSDFFDSPEGVRAAGRLRQFRQRLSGHIPARLPTVSVESYRGRKWVTRPRPHVDRLGCAWLIRRVIDPKAKIRYSHQPESDEVRFDMRAAEFGHHEDLCTFETMLLRFGLSDPALQAIAEIVHDIDLRDHAFARPEAPGIDALLRGWLFEKLSDQELEDRGLTLFQALYAYFGRQPAVS